MELKVHQKIYKLINSLIVEECNSLHEIGANVTWMVQLKEKLKAS